MMCPVHEAAQIVPFVHPTNIYPVAHANGNTFGEVNIMNHQQGPAGAYVQYESLVPRAVVIIRQQALDEPADFDPRVRVAFFRCGVQAMPMGEKNCGGRSLAAAAFFVLTEPTIRRSQAPS